MKAAKAILALALFASLMFVFTSCTCKPELEEEKVTQPAAMTTPVAGTPSEVKPAAISTGVVTIGDRVVDIGDHIFPIYFDFDKATLRSDARETLGKLAQWLKVNPEINLRIDGHCDDRGSDEYNLALGENRAASAEKYLVYLGISPEHFELLSYGEEKPVCSEQNESCWSRNRRVEFTITAK